MFFFYFYQVTLPHKGITESKKKKKFSSDGPLKSVNFANICNFFSDNGMDVGGSKNIRSSFKLDIFYSFENGIAFRLHSVNLLLFL